MSSVPPVTCGLELPCEMIQYILEFLSTLDLVTAATVVHGWRLLACRIVRSRMVLFKVDICISELLFYARRNPLPKKTIILSNIKETYLKHYAAIFARFPPATLKMRTSKNFECNGTSHVFFTNESQDNPAMTAIEITIKCIDFPLPRSVWKQIARNAHDGYYRIQPSVIALLCEPV